MGDKKRLKGNINIRDINVNVPECPGCKHQHDITLSRPITTKNCSYGMGSFMVSVVSRMGYIEVSVHFQDTHYTTEDITTKTVITVSSD